MKKLIKISSLLLFCFLLISGTIDLNNLQNYSDQEVPSYIVKDNTDDNEISNEIATLGRVLFYDKRLSTDNSISCANCHIQEFGFGDTSSVSIGVNGTTNRHSMRLINSRFAEEKKFFWDKRAETLEEQTTQPIKDHIEMGYSWMNGDLSIEDLISEIDTLTYYDLLFELAFGDQEITEERMQKSLAQFVRSIQSFDSKYDVGRLLVDSHLEDFPNFTPSENMGKLLFSTTPLYNLDGERISGGVGCISCHRAPEFDIDPESLNNGVIFAPNGDLDLEVTRSPTLRDIFNSNGQINGPLMHNANLQSFTIVLQHYNFLNDFSNQPNINNSIDERLRPFGLPQKLQLTDSEKQQLEDFIKTLSGTDVYINEKWSNPFDENENIEIIGTLSTTKRKEEKLGFKIYPNPFVDKLFIKSNNAEYSIELYSLIGTKLLAKSRLNGDQVLNLEFTENSGIYYLKIMNSRGRLVLVEKIIKY